MNGKIKSPEFVVCNGLENVINGNGNPPSIMPGMCITLSYKDYLVEVKTGPKSTDIKDFWGTVIAVDIDTEVFQDIKVGDKVNFKRENIVSIGQKV